MDWATRPTSHPYGPSSLIDHGLTFHSNTNPATRDTRTAEAMNQGEQNSRLNEARMCVLEAPSAEGNAVQWALV